MNAHSSPRLTSAAAHDAPERPATSLLVVAWLFLVMLAVVGRAWQPGWNIAPMAAVALAAGAFFPSTILAASVPVVALVISNLFLPAYEHPLMAVVVYASLTWPILIGRFGLLGGAGRNTRWFAVTGGALASSLVFFFTTNVAHWALMDMYPKSAAGLLTCLAAGLPFYRWAPVGDIVWSLGLFGLLAGMVKVGDALATRGLVAASVARDTRLTGGPQA